MLSCKFKLLNSNIDKQSVFQSLDPKIKDYYSLQTVDYLLKLDLEQS